MTCAKAYQILGAMRGRKEETEGGEKEEIKCRSAHLLKKHFERKQKKTATPAADPAAAAGSSSSGGGAAPVAPAAPMSGGKKALLGAALRDLTSVLGRPAGAAPAGGLLSRKVGSILSLALDNNANGLFAQPQGIFDFGKESFLFGRGFLGAGGGKQKKKKRKEKLSKLTLMPLFLLTFSYFFPRPLNKLDAL